MTFFVHLYMSCTDFLGLCSWMLHLLIWSHWTLRAELFFLSLYSSSWINFYWLIFKFTDLFFCHLHSAYCQEGFLIYLLYLSFLKLSFSSFLQCLFISWDFISFHSCQECSLCIMLYSYKIAALKSLRVPVSRYISRMFIVLFSWQLDKYSCLFVHGRVFYYILDIMKVMLCKLGILLYPSGETNMI